MAENDDAAYWNRCYRSVVCLSVFYTCAQSLPKPLDGMRRQGHWYVPIVTLCQIGTQASSREREIWGQNPIRSDAAYRQNDFDFGPIDIQTTVKTSLPKLGKCPSTSSCHIKLFHNHVSDVRIYFILYT